MGCFICIIMICLNPRKHLTACLMHEITKQNITLKTLYPKLILLNEINWNTNITGICYYNLNLAVSNLIRSNETWIWEYFSTSSRFKQYSSISYYFCLCRWGTFIMVKLLQEWHTVQNFPVLPKIYVQSDPFGMRTVSFEFGRDPAYKIFRGV